MMARGRVTGETNPGRAHAPWSARCNSVSAWFADDETRGALFERRQFFQALIDVGAAISLALIATIAAGSIVGAFFILFFVRPS